jgi:hypothetical protein
MSCGCQWRLTIARIWCAGCIIAAILIALFSGASDAQQSTCPNWSQGAKIHPTGETVYTIQVTDQCATLIFKNTNAEVVNLPNPGSHFPYGFWFRTFSSGAGGITFTPTSPVTVNGTTTLAKAQNGYGYCVTDGTGWWC